MSNVFFASDHHLGHGKILQFEPKRSVFGSIEEHDEYIVAQHNKTVGKRDITWFLGDVNFHRDFRYFAELVSSMNGEKHLVLGNHDIFLIDEYLKVFASVHAMKAKYKTVMTHIPLHPSSVKRWGLNIHGHTHSKVVPQTRAGEGQDNNYFCVSMEQNDFRPFSLDQIRQHQKTYSHIVQPSRSGRDCETAAQCDKLPSLDRKQE